MLSVFTFLMSMVYVIACHFLIFVVLIQKGEGGGLGGLAGGGAVDVAFGAKADMTWKRATGVAAFIFITVSLLLGVLERPRSVTKDVQNPSPTPSPSSSTSTPPKLPNNPIPPMGSPTPLTPPSSSSPSPAQSTPASTPSPAQSTPASTPSPAQSTPASTPSPAQSTPPK